MAYAVLSTSLQVLREVAGRVTKDQLDNPTPCAEWTVTQVLFHAAGDQLGWASMVADSPLPTWDPFAPPATLDGEVADLIEPALRAATAAWDSVEPGAESVRTPLPPFPTMAPELAAGACALDAAVHAWDIAVATGRPSPLTAALAEQLLPAAHATVEPLRGFAYASAEADLPDDDAAARLLRYLGRDPFWNA
ncbi:TIGR03086 family metal-binding protein [Paractinoplanes lichenicola]|uniref:TIGR03086 family protein n=1 Tax=Paractinoplanes lichenicola TaxID=2802976 RepID=A0ABS1W0M7_9ACTN|nr:TIGR03086 family metal-binding protein [Actinoplanes lichenicola]MBL7260118.1 TIGR03086 family protein [Actinoplanes lichenicola]